MPMYKNPEELIHASGAGDDHRVRELLRAGWDIDGKAENVTALYIATTHNHASTVKLLLDHGADVKKVGICKCTPLELAAFHGYDNIFNLLQGRGSNVDALDVFGFNSLFTVAWSGNYNLAYSLLQNLANVKYSRNGKQAIDAVGTYHEHDEDDEDCINCLFTKTLLAITEAKLEEIISFALHSAANHWKEFISFIAQFNVTELMALKLKAQVQDHYCKNILRYIMSSMGDQFSVRNMVKKMEESHLQQIATEFCKAYSACVTDIYVVVQKTIESGSKIHPLLYVASICEKVHWGLHPGKRDTPGDIYNEMYLPPSTKQDGLQMLFLPEHCQCTEAEKQPFPRQWVSPVYKRDELKVNADANCNQCTFASESQCTFASEGHTFGASSHNKDRLYGHQPFMNIQPDNTLPKQRIDNDRPTGKEIAFLAMSLGFEWEILALYLDLPHCVIDQCKMANPHFMPAMSATMLTRWRQCVYEQPEEERCEELRRALKDVGRHDLAKKFEN